MAPTKKSSDKEKYDKQKQLARERQRKRRAKLTAEELEKKRQYDRIRYIKEKEQKKKKSIKEMSEREQRKTRKIWRDQYNKKKEKKALLAAALVNTPPDSPHRDDPVEVQQANRGESSQKKRGRKAVRKDRSKAYRTIDKQNKRIEELERRVRKYKKRLERQKQKLNPTTSPSPRKQVSSLVKKSNISPKIKKQLFLGLTLQKQLEKKAKTLAGQKKEGQQFRKVIGNEILKKYRVQKYFQKILPYKANKVIQDNPSEYSRKKRSAIRDALSKELQAFFEDDSVSKICPGKRDVVKRGKTVKQRRVLLDTLCNLHAKFQDEMKCKISLTSFSRSRPFWVTFPKRCDRETCGCIKHDNFGLLVESLRAMKVIKQKNSTEVVRSVTCCEKYKSCMFGECNDCKDNTIELSFDSDFQIKYWKWMTIKEVKFIKKKKKVVKKTAKVKLVKRLSEVIKNFKNELIDFKRHTYFAHHQTCKLKRVLKNLKRNELVFRIDFAENYVCKYGKEIQSVHFGASKCQISMHTGVRYSNYDNQSQTSCFCTVSNNLDHQAHAVWAHLQPILERSAQQFPNVDTIHFFSDSPSSQYRNRTNLHFFKTIVPSIFRKLKSMSWNFTEAGHGKGTMDGVGGTLKREADRAVSYGKDITNAAGFVKALSSVDIFLLEISSKSIENIKKQLGWLVIPSIDGITKAHQITFSTGSQMNANLLSCFECPMNDICKHYNLFPVFPDLSVDLQKKKRILRVEDVFSSDSEDTSDDPTNFQECGPSNDNVETESDKCEDILETKIDIGSFVVIRINPIKASTSSGHLFVAICQSQVVGNEFEVMFMKSESDNKTFFPDDKDVSYVNLNQVVTVLPNPNMIVRGNRVFYKFIAEPLIGY